MQSTTWDSPTSTRRNRFAWRLAMICSSAARRCWASPCRAGGRRGRFLAHKLRRPYGRIPRSGRGTDHDRHVWRAAAGRRRKCRCWCAKTRASAATEERPNGAADEGWLGRQGRQWLRLHAIASRLRTMLRGPVAAACWFWTSRVGQAPRGFIRLWMPMGWRWIAVPRRGRLPLGQLAQDLG